VRGALGRSRPSTSLTAAMNLRSPASPLRSIMPRPVISRISTERSAGPSRDWSALSNWASDILAAPLLVIENRIGDTGPDHLAFEREGQCLAHPVAAILDQRHGDRTIERSREIGRSDLGDHLHRRLVLDRAHRIGAVRQNLLRLVRQKPDHLLAAGTFEEGLLKR